MGIDGILEIDLGKVNDVLQAMVCVGTLDDFIPAPG
jgi:hypothetical protein